MKTYYVYILANKPNGALYVGVTSNLLERMNQHKQKQIDGFTKKYDISDLVYFEQTEYINAALIREKNLKNWHRSWKVELIEKNNPSWRDLSEDF
ncbi:MAG: GIY-YIG nuclease family protein [Chloroflexi bacterium]|nr:MAG: GIY-YIG nuclease family protein [Chloroflexota bacterium]